MLIKQGPIFIYVDQQFFTGCAEEVALWIVQSYEESLWKQYMKSGAISALYLIQGTLATDIKVNPGFLHLVVHNSYQVPWQIQLCIIFGQALHATLYLD